MERRQGTRPGKEKTKTVGGMVLLLRRENPKCKPKLCWKIVHGTKYNPGIPEKKPAIGVRKETADHGQGAPVKGSGENKGVQYSGEGGIKKSSRTRESQK